MEQYIEFAEQHGITITAKPVSSRPDSDSGMDAKWNREADHFFVTLDRLPSGFEADRPTQVLWSGYYSTGAAHPEHWARDNAKSLGYRERMALRELKTSKRTSLHAEQQRETLRAAYRKAAPLKVSDVLYSLQMDSMNWECLFEDWAGDYGYDTDSIKARDIFESCQRTAKTLRGILGAALFEQFQNLEEV